MLSLPFIASGVVFRRDVDASRIGAVPRGSGYDVLGINQEYVEFERPDLDEVWEEISSESDALRELEAAIDSPDELRRILDARYDDDSQFSVVDVGLSGIVAALVCVGAKPITSCNGGVFGDWHASQVPHVLFACSRRRLPFFLRVAEASGCGLINNGRFLELFCDDLRKLHSCARLIVDMPENRRV